MPGRLRKMPEARELPTAPALEALYGAVSLVRSDPHAISLLDGGSASVEIDSPLANWLYTRWWSDADPQPVEDAGRWPGVLEAARRSVAPLEPDWIVIATTARELIAARRPGAAEHTSGAAPATTVRTRIDAVAQSSRPGCPVRPGDLVTLWSGASGLDDTGAWWWARTGSADASGEVERRYLNVRAAEAPAVIAATLSWAAAAGAELSLKCPAWPGGFNRRDAMVAYLPGDSLAALEALQDGWLGRLAPLLSEATPPLTRRLAPGVGASGDPGGGVSYGQLRCAQVAAAVFRLEKAGGSAAGVLASVGIDPTRPWELAS